MTRMTRRSVLRYGCALSLPTLIAGCTADTESENESSSGIPGVDDGEISDTHAFATAHSDQIASRTGTIEWLDVSLDRETGDAEEHILQNAQVDGNQVYAVSSGRSVITEPKVDRREIYFEGNTVAIRSRTDGRWDAVLLERQETSISKSSLTGKSELESASMNKVGTKTIDGEQLHWFSTVGQNKSDGQSMRFNTQAVVDAQGLVYDYQKSFNDTNRNNRGSRQWVVSDLDKTTVKRPDWVDEIEN